MSRILLGKSEIDPAVNPAILDTVTWDRNAVRTVIGSVSGQSTVLENALKKGISATVGSIQFHGSSVGYAAGGSAAICTLPDNQALIVTDTVRTGEIFESEAGRSGKLIWFETSAENLERYGRHIRPDKGSRAMGPVPRLGIGGRMTTAVWPAVWRSMDRIGYAANAVQNSTRELNTLADLRAGIPPRTNHLFSFGAIQEGHTGSTFEGLWTSGVLSALISPTIPRFGSDADHIQVKRADTDLSRARELLDASARYTFYTLDVSDILNYEALLNWSSDEAEEALDKAVPNAALKRSLKAYHRIPRRIGGLKIALGEEQVTRYLAKYWDALNALQKLQSYVTGFKNGRKFDFEFSIDENPPEVATADCVTRFDELAFLLVELERRLLDITHIAPNFGVEKGRDYRGEGGLPVLEERVRVMQRMCEEFGLRMDCHSGDDLKQETRRTIGRGAQGRINFKVSPYLQILFGEVLEEIHPDVFRFWWDETVDAARKEASKGSVFAAEMIRELEDRSSGKPGANHPFFQHLCFVPVGLRDDNGQFLNRHRFYSLSGQFYEEYSRRLEIYLSGIAADIFDPAAYGEKSAE